MRKLRVLAVRLVRRIELCQTKDRICTPNTRIWSFCLKAKLPFDHFSQAGEPGRRGGNTAGRRTTSPEPEEEQTDAPAEAVEEKIDPQL